MLYRFMEGMDIQMYHDVHRHWRDARLLTIAEGNFLKF